MSRKHHIEVSSVALVELKAEISRRQSEVKQKAQTLPEGCSVLLKRPATSGVISGRNGSLWRKKPSSSIIAHAHDDATFGLQDVGNIQHSEELERSKRSLEAKAKLYEALKQTAMSGTTPYSMIRMQAQNDDDGFLVDFEEKALQERSNPPYSPSPISDNSIDEEDDVCHSGEKAVDCSDWKNPRMDEEGSAAAPLRSDSEPPLRPDGPLTYAHLREGEIRDHGVGFYAFSEDVEQREAEMTRLRELHRATEEGRARAQVIRTKRDVKMGQRLAQLRARKGLPDVATAAAQCLAQTSAPPTPLPPVRADAQSDLQLTSEDLDVASMLRRLRDEAEFRAASTNPVPQYTEPVAPEPKATNLADVAETVRPKESYRLKQSREWDRGKSMISAQRYIQSEREKRPSDFAPPSFY